MTNCYQFGFMTQCNSESEPDLGKQIEGQLAANAQRKREEAAQRELQEAEARKQAILDRYSGGKLIRYRHSRATANG